MKKNKLKVILGVTPEDCIEEFPVEISRVSITYSQSPDTNSPPEQDQYLTVEAENCDMGPEGMYFTIKSDKWAVNDPEDLMYLLQDFKKRVTVGTVPESKLKLYKQKVNLQK